MLAALLLAAALAPRAIDAFGPNSLVVLSVVDQTSATSPVTLTEFDYTIGNIVDTCSSPQRALPAPRAQRRPSLATQPLGPLRRARRQAAGPRTNVASFPPSSAPAAPLLTDAVPNTVMNANAPDPGFVGQISLCGDSTCFSYVGQSVNACVFCAARECRPPTCSRRLAPALSRTCALACAHRERCVPLLLPSPSNPLRNNSPGITIHRHKSTDVFMSTGNTMTTIPGAHCASPRLRSCGGR